MVVGTAEVIELWHQEVKRIYDRLRIEFRDHIGELNEAQASWEAFYSAELKAMRVANDKDGTLYRIAFSEERLRLVSDFAKGLARWGRF